MDGEHAFSAALTLVMVNVALSVDDRDTAAMECALSVLRNMAEKGNGNIGARLALLANIRSTIRPSVAAQTYDRPFPLPDPTFPASDPSQLFDLANVTMPLADNNLQPEDGFQPFQDVSFNFEMDDDPTLWDEISGNIDIDMDTVWIETALRREAYQPPPGLEHHKSLTLLAPSHT